jgi:hypothetical protein
LANEDPLELVFLVDLILVEAVVLLVLTGVVLLTGVDVVFVYTLPFLINVLLPSVPIKYFEPSVGSIQ